MIERYVRSFFFKFRILIFKIIRNLSNDQFYYEFRYLFKYRKRLRLKNPSTFNEKLNWLKLYDRNPFYTKIVDKFSVRGYVAEKVGDKYLIPIIGTYDNINELDFDLLPNSFVLKPTHGSGWVIMCRDKSNFDVEAARTEIDGWLKINYYQLHGEWPYKDVPPKIICEELISTKNQSDLMDYKFYCFNGEARFFHVDIDRFQKHSRNFYDLEFNRLPFSLEYPQASFDISRPVNLNEMVKIANTLSNGFKFIRVDIYNNDGTIYFGEMTLFPGNGLELFTPNEYDLKIGKLINI